MKVETKTGEVHFSSFRLRKRLRHLRSLEMYNSPIREKFTTFSHFVVSSQGSKLGSNLLVPTTLLFCRILQSVRLIKWQIADSPTHGHVDVKWDECFEIYCLIIFYYYVHIMKMCDPQYSYHIYNDILSRAKYRRFIFY